MTRYATAEDLMNGVLEELRRAERFATRFILVHGVDSWDRVVAMIRREVDRELRLSRYCTGADVFPDLEQLMRDLRDPGAVHGQVLLTPLAECLRLSPEAAEIIRTLAQWPVGNVTRLYVPLFAAESLLLTELQQLARYSEGLLPEIWHLEGLGVTDLVVAPFIPDFTSRQMYAGLKAYLARWEQGGVDRAWLATGLSSWLKGHQVGSEYRARVFPSSFEYVRQTVGQETWQARLGEHVDWDWLARQVHEDEGLDDVAKRVLNAADFDPQQLLTLWSTLDDRSRWLAWLWFKSRVAPGSYLYHVLDGDSQFREFPRSAILAVFDQPVSTRLSAERRALLESLRCTEKPADFWKRYRGIQTAVDQVAVLTSTSQAECEELVKLAGQLAQTTPRDQWWDRLESAWPQLTWYLDAPLTGQAFADDYFAEYRRCRLRDEASEHLLSLVEEWADRQLLWSFPTRGSRLAAEVLAGTALMWVDGLGVEWLGLIRHLVVQDAIAWRAEVVRASLPSTTTANAEWSPEERPIRGLDDVAHHYAYSFPESFVKALGVVEEVSRQAGELLSRHARLVLVADHGLSRFSAKSTDRAQVPEGGGIELLGRAARLAPLSEIGEPPSRCVVENGVAYMQTHALFRGSIGARGEMHGGAAPEEILIPLVVLERVDARATPGFELLTRQVRLSARGDGEVRVGFDRIVTEAELQIAGLTAKGHQGPEGSWVFALKGLRSGAYSCRLAAEGKYVGRIDIQLTGGLDEDDLGLEVPPR